MCTTLFRDCEREGAAKTVYRACLQGGKVTETPAKRVVSWVEYYPWSLLRLENDKSSSSQALRVASIIDDVKLNAVRIQVLTILAYKWTTSLPKRNVPTEHQCVVSNILEERARGCYFNIALMKCKVGIDWYQDTLSKKHFSICHCHWYADVSSTSLYDAMEALKETFCIRFFMEKRKPECYVTTVLRSRLQFAVRVWTAGRASSGKWLTARFLATKNCTASRFKVPSSFLYLSAMRLLD